MRELDKYDLIGRATMMQYHGADYYSELGQGECLDENQYEYDRATYTNVLSPDNCADYCAERVLLIEHRGMSYDSDESECHCLYDNSTVPRPLIAKMKAGRPGMFFDENEISLANHAHGRIEFSDEDSYRANHITCYRKNYVSNRFVCLIFYTKGS